MDKNGGSRAKIRLSLDVSPEFNDRLEELSQLTHSNRRAMCCARRSG